MKHMIVIARTQRELTQVFDEYRARLTYGEVAKMQRGAGHQQIVLTNGNRVTFQTRRHTTRGYRADTIVSIEFTPTQDEADCYAASLAPSRTGELIHADTFTPQTVAELHQRIA